MPELIGIDSYKDAFQKKIEKLQGGLDSPDLMLIAGVSGTGKSALLEHLHDTAAEDFPQLPRSIVSGEGGVGDTSISQTQPLAIISGTLEKLLNFRPGKAKKRFAYNVGITMLTALPLIGDVFYAAKEIGRDYEKYQKEMKDENAFSSSQIEDFYAALVQLSQKNPLLIMIDDAHNADSASVELLQELAGKDSDARNIQLIISYDPDVLINNPSPFSSWINTTLNSSSTTLFQLKPLSAKQLSVWLSSNLDGYIQGPEFERWVMDRTAGNQSILNEYLRYFKKNPPISEEGIFRKEFYDKFLPSNIYDAIKELSGQLSSDDTDFLCTASAEGNEFTVFMLSELTSESSVSVIRKLRKIQNETGLIKPLGLQRRYGEKTTVYAFSRQFYHNYFEGQLQYEEQVELHSRIAEKLKKKFEQSDSPYEKAQLVGYIAAHSKEADNPEIAESVLAESAGLLGGADIDALAQKLGLSIDLSAMEEIETSISSGEVNGIGGEGDALNSIEAPIDIGLPFNMLRHRVATFHNLGKLSEAYQETKRHLKFGDRVYSKREMIMLLVMQAKTLIDLRELENAESVLDKAKKLAGDSPDEQVKCLLMNTEAIILDEKGDNGKAQEVLQEAAKLAFTLQPELKLMTLANIGRLIEEKDPELAEKYYDASEKLRGELSLSGLIIRN